MPKRLILVRHGTTDHNRRHLLQGWLDTPLNQEGLEQAQRLAKHLAQHYHFDHIYTSDLKRAHTTAKAIAEETQVPLTPTFLLRETNLGILQGHNWKELPPKLNKIWQQLREATHLQNLDWKEHQGESLGQVYQRLKNFLRHLYLNHQNQVIVVVTHGGILNRILELLNLKDLEEFISYHNTAITILDKTTSQTYQLTSLNDISHLSK